MIELTAFKNVYDNKTHRRMAYDNWTSFIDVLYHMSKIDGYKPKKGEPYRGMKPSPLITPSVYDRGTTRSNDNVKYWAGWAALDIDDYDGSMEDAVRLFKGYSFVCYSSASSTKANPKFRIVVELSNNVMSRDIKPFWYALNKEFNSLGDPQTKDLSRMYYVPAKYPDAFNFIFTQKGDPISPKSLMLKHPFIEPKKSIFDNLPLEMQRQMVQDNMANLTDTDHSWTSYRDCPFVNHKLVDEYACIQGTGWYTMLYRIMVSISFSAVKQGYPITPSEVEGLVREIDNDHGGWYDKRPLGVESTRAVDYAIRHGGL